MRQLIVGLVLILFAAKGAHSFQIDGLNSGMSMEKARKILESSSYKNIQSRDNGIIASDANRFILLNFCKDELILVQKHLSPGFDNFVRLIDEKRKELGNPTDAWTDPADANLPIERNAVSFLWRDSLTSVRITYTEFASNKQLDVLFEAKNACRQVLN